MSGLPLPQVAELLRDGGAAHLHDGCYWYLHDDRHAMASSEKELEGNALKNFFKRWPGVYRVLVAIIGPSLFTGLTTVRFVKTLSADATILHAGSGTRSFGQNCVNVDLFPFPNVQVIADLAHLPFKDGVFDAITCEQVLEHTPRPWEITAEFIRVTKPGGLIHIACPFVFPWHPSPSDYSRWTLQGQAALFPNCTIVKQGITAGPFSTLTAFIAAFVSIILCFGSKRLQSAIEFIVLLLLCWVKLPDLLIARLPIAHRLAANLYSVVSTPAAH